LHFLKVVFQIYCQFNKINTSSTLFQQFLVFYNKDYVKTKELCTKAIQLNPSYGPAYYNRGLALQMLREEENCCRDWKKAAELGVDAAKSLVTTFCD